MPSAGGYGVIGAGPAGLVTLKALRAHGVAAEILERHTEVGGLFAGRPGRGPDPSVHLTCSAAASAFRGLPFGRGRSLGRPSFARAHAYLGAYAAAHDLRRHIRLGTEVTRMDPCPDGGWSVTTGDGAVRRYRGVVLAIGGAAGGPAAAPVGPAAACAVIAAPAFRGPEEVTGLRVLVTGGGNAACDIAVEAALSARSVLLVLPRDLPLPAEARAAARRIAGPLLAARGRDHGLPRPDPALFGDGSRAVRLRDAVRRGAVAVHPPLARLDGRTALFADGTREPVDVVVDASAPGIDLPFLDHWQLPWENGMPRLLWDVAHPARTDLFATGLVPVAGPAWPVFEAQAELIARLVRAADRRPATLAALRGSALRRSGGGARAARRATRLLDRALADRAQAGGPGQPAVTQAT
jgi:hypothetical protein